MTDYQLEDRIRAEVHQAEKRAAFLAHAFDDLQTAHETLKAEHAQLKAEHAALKDKVK